MKIAVLGATGRTGIPLLRQALDAGHSVSALVRDRTKLPTELVDHERLEAVEGDVMRRESVERSLSGCDAVASALAHTGSHTPPNMMSLAAEHVISVMRDRKMPGPFVLMLDASIEAQEDNHCFKDRLNKFFGRYILGALLVPQFYRDGCEQARLIREEDDVRWSIVRPTAITNGAHTGQYRHGLPDELSIAPWNTVSRADVADLMLQICVNENGVGDKYNHKMPFICM